MLHSKTFHTRSIGWALFGVNFRPLQEIEAIMGGERIFDTGPFFARLTVNRKVLFTNTKKMIMPVEPHTHVIIEFYLQRILPEVGVVIVHVGLDRGTKKSLLVESFESLPVYFGIVTS